MNWPTGAAAMRRRGFLALAVGVPTAAVLAGCAPSPLIVPGPSPSPTPTLDSARRAAATANATLAELAAACGGIPGVAGEFATWCSALAELHRAHLVVLAQADPLGGVQTDHTAIEPIGAQPFELPGDQPQAMALLATEEAALADLVAPAALDPGHSPGMALLWISQLVSARVYSGALAGGTTEGLGPAAVAGDAVPAELGGADGDEELTAAVAREVLLSHQRALVFGLQAILGNVSGGDGYFNAVSERLDVAMRERDATVAAIVASGATPPPPAAQYSLPGDPADQSQRDQLWGRLELAVMTGWARLAACDADGREPAIEGFLLAAQRTRSLWVGLPHWPGWV